MLLDTRWPVQKEWFGAAAPAAAAAAAAASGYNLVMSGGASKPKVSRAWDPPNVSFPYWATVRERQILWLLLQTRSEPSRPHKPGLYRGRYSRIGSCQWVLAGRFAHVLAPFHLSPISPSHISKLHSTQAPQRFNTFQVRTRQRYFENAVLLSGFSLRRSPAPTCPSRAGRPVHWPGNSMGAAHAVRELRP